MRSGRPTVIAVAIVLMVGACSSRGSGEQSAVTNDTAASAAVSADFGSITAPCGPGDATVDPAQNGGPTLKVGTPTDKGFEARPGLNIEVEDAAKAFIGWCNELGGVMGVPLELVELDAALGNVPAVIEKACDTVFALVGGGMVFDDQVFPRFHECGMIDFPGFQVTPIKAMSNGMAPASPNPVDVRTAGWFEWVRDNRPADGERVAVLYGNVGATELVARQTIESMEVVGGFTIVDEIPYNAVGEANWAPFAQRIKDNNITMVHLVGEPDTLVSLMRSMDEIGYRPPLILQETNFYDAAMTEGAGDLTEGMVVRTVFSPLEEPDESPATARYLELMQTYNPSGKIAGLGIQAMSAFLLFVTSANACAEVNDNVIERECVLEQALSVTSWDGGGLHAPSDPSTNSPPGCAMLLEVRNGSFTRLFPDRGSADDDGGGWNCSQVGLIKLTGDYGDTTIGVDPNRPN